MAVLDKGARERLIAEVAAQRRVGGEIAVPLDLFFVGNDDPGSIGCNLGDRQPLICDFYEKLVLLRERPEVQDIWVRICDANDENRWPYTDTVYVISSLPQDEIEAALEGLGFDEVVAGWIYGRPESAPRPEAGSTPYSVWWD
jgi:hypothetical protein